MEIQFSIFHHQRKLINIYYFRLLSRNSRSDVIIYIYIIFVVPPFYTCSSDVFPRWNLKALCVCVCICLLLSLHNFAFPWHNDIELVIWHLGWIFSFCLFSSTHKKPTMMENLIKKVLLLCVCIFAWARRS